MEKYVFRVTQRLGSFSVWKMEHVPKDCNDKSDALAAVASSLPITETILLPIYYQLFSSITPSQVSQVEEVFPSWMDPIIHYINTRELPSKKDKAHKVQVQSTRFSLIDGQLFKRSLGGPYLKVLTPEQGNYVLVELHKGICRNHPSGRMLAHRAHTQGYYWQTMKANAANYTKKCDRCQRLAPILKSPMQDLISISSPWPFTQWGIDIVRPPAHRPGLEEIIVGGN